MEEQERTPGRGSEAVSDNTNDLNTTKHMAGVFAELARTARVESAFGQAHTAAGSTVIPVAEVISGLGFGSGGASAPDGTGSGGAGGGFARSRPVALVVIDDDGVRVEPVLDLGRLFLAGLAVAGFTAVWLLRLLRASAPGGVATAKMPSARAFGSLVGRTQ